MAKDPAHSEEIGFVGLGTMGAPMAANLAKKGFDVRVWNRTRPRPDALEPGVTLCDTPAQLAARSSVVVTCVTDAPQLEEILFGPRGLHEGLREGSLVIDCSTLSPLRAQEFGQRLKPQGVAFVDAPVSGGSEGARLATLSIMVGGEDADVERARPILLALGTTVTHLGPLGAGQWTKAVNQVILAGTYLGVAEGLTLAMKAGLDPRQVVSALGGGAAGSWVLTNRSERMIENNYPLGFKIALHRKDLGIALELAEGLGAELPVAALAASFEDELVRDGYGDEDNAALARIIRGRAGL